MKGGLSYCESSSGCHPGLRPNELGADTCNLVFVSDASNSPEFRVALRVRVRSSSQVYEFVQTDRR